MSYNGLNLLGKRVCELRCSLKMSQEKLADCAGLSARHISELERGKVNPTYEVLLKIANAMGLSVLDLLDFKHVRQREELRNELIDILDSLPEEKFRLAYKIVCDVMLTL